MKIAKTFIAMLSFTTLFACTSPEERAEQQAQKETSECTDAGYQPNTPAFDDCLSQVKARDDQRAADRLKAATDLPNLRQDSSLPSQVSIPMR